MIFTIHRENEPDRLVRIGYGSIDISPKVPDDSPPPLKSKQGRKKMADEKKFDDVTGVKKISQERADKQGPIGTGAERPVNPQPSEDVKIGNREGEKNG